MRTRNQSKRLKEQEKEQTVAGDSGAHSTLLPKPRDGGGSLTKISKEGVGKLLNRANSRKGRKGRRPLEDTKEESPKESHKLDNEQTQDFGLKGCVSRNAEKCASNKGKGVEGNIRCDANEMDWEDGTVSVPEFWEGYSHEQGREVIVEFTESPSSAQKKRSRRASAEDKELAELVHKVHLLCLIARGRLVDNACNDPLIQASILSLLPSYLLKIMETPRVRANMLGSVVNWFQNVFYVRSQSIDRGSFQSNLAHALETREGTSEEIAALSVALFRALNLRTRYVSILDVASLKPDANISELSTQDAPGLDTRINSYASTRVYSHQGHALYSSDLIDTTKKPDGHESENERLCKKESNSTDSSNLLKSVSDTNQPGDGASQTAETRQCSGNLDPCSMESATVSKRKGDLEFQLQMEMALSATAAGTHDSERSSELLESQNFPAPVPPSKKLKMENAAVSSPGSSSTVWSRKLGPPSHWAEVYCSLETLTGKWVHIDAANGVVDGEGKIEAAVAACRRPLKYVVAFSGNGAKDVTRRYCLQWYKIAPRRVNSDWWDKVLAPLKELEVGATCGMTDVEVFRVNAVSDLKKNSEIPPSSVVQSSCLHTTCSKQENPDNEKLAGEHSLEGPNQVGQQCRSESLHHMSNLGSGISLEDVELETKALTEPLPTNQQAYRHHHLYAIERWLTKHQILHPRGPILGYCSGYPVYPRSCVQTLQTKQKWLREGFQIKANETPAKVVKRLKKNENFQISEPSITEEDDGGTGTTIELYGKWQLEPLQLPHAVNGIVPKNEWGRVDVWSEKCLPPGTVHLRLPRIVPVVRRLEIDFAPAMVGFDFRNGRSFPVYEGIVVCTEFRDAILEAYEEEEESRESEKRKRNEAQALSNWFQLLSSIVTRQRLHNSYADSSSHAPQDLPTSESAQISNLEGHQHPVEAQVQIAQDANSVLHNDHEHVFPIEDQTFDEESMVRTKRCPCGFSIEVEEL